MTWLILVVGVVAAFGYGYICGHVDGKLAAFKSVLSEIDRIKSDREV